MTVSPVLICAATRAEEIACKKGLEVSGHSARFEVLRTGMGLIAAERALRARFESGPLPTRVFSTGYAGAWSSDLQIGDWVTASDLWEEAGSGFARARFQVEAFSGFARRSRAEARNEPEDSISKLKHCSLVSVTRLMRSPDLSQTPLPRMRLAVDMESLALARVCAERGVPLTVLRWVTDTPSEPLPEFVGSFSSALLADSFSERLALGTQGFANLFRRPADVAGLLQGGAFWAKGLSELWRLAPGLV